MWLYIYNASAYDNAMPLLWYFDKAVNVGSFV